MPFSTNPRDSTEVVLSQRPFPQIRGTPQRLSYPNAPFHKSAGLHRGCPIPMSYSTNPRGLYRGCPVSLALFSTRKGGTGVDSVFAVRFARSGVFLTASWGG